MRQGSRRVVIGGLVLTIAVACVVGVVYLFRQETDDNPELGLITYHYRWGQRVELTADTNRDGRYDVRAILDDQVFPTEYWEDSNYNGTFDRHVVMNGAVIDYIRLDQDGDGEYEHRLEGVEAQDFYNSRSEGTRKLLHEAPKRLDS